MKYVFINNFIIERKKCENSNALITSNIFIKTIYNRIYFVISLWKNMRKHFFEYILSVDFWQKLLEQIKLALKVSQKSVVRSRI